MKKSKLNSGQPALLKRKLVRQVIAIVILSIAITGGLLAFFCFETRPGLYNIPLQAGLDKLIPGLFEIILLSVIAILLSLSAAFILFNKAFRRYEQSIDNEQDDERESAIEQSDMVAIQDDCYPKTFADAGTITETLATERLLNNLIMSLLSVNNDEKQTQPDDVLDKLGAFCKSDYIAFYHQNPETGVYDRNSYRDANPAVARHSDKLNAFDVTLYPWMFDTIKTDKPFIFDRVKMEKLVEELQDANDEARIWMHKQAVETAEYKLCKHEDWQYFVALPYLNNETKGIFLIGFHCSALPLAKDVLERLTSISTALGNKILNKHGIENQSEAKEGIETTLANISDAVFTTNPDGIITMANPAAAKMIDRAKSEIIGTYWSEAFNLVDTDSRMFVNDPLKKAGAGNGSYHLPSDVMLLTADECEILIEGMVAPIQAQTAKLTGYVFILRDITERINVETERIKTQKMEAISSLSAGLAHDFNNLLTAILGNISLVLDDLPPESEHAQTLKAAEECTLKGRDITNRLLTFAKSSPMQDSTSEAATNLERIVLELVDGTNVKPIFEFDSDLPTIKMAATIFETVITNLVSNAMQAMNPSGVLKVMATIYDNADGSVSTLSPGKYVCIHIIDNGEGISRENQSRIFTPYYTTREGRSGLGLPSVNSILAKHNGAIKVHSQPGKGTDCELFIPVANPTTSNQAEPEPEVIPNQNYVLVMDEQDMLGNLLIRTLVKIGLQVERTSDPDELVALYYKNIELHRQASLVLLNLDVPANADIMKLAAQLKQADPKLKLIAYGSHIHLDDLADYQKKGFDDILRKPFNITDLKALITKTLEV